MVSHACPFRIIYMIDFESLPCISPRSDLSSWEGTERDYFCN